MNFRLDGTDLIFITVMTVIPLIIIGIGIMRHDSKLIYEPMLIFILNPFTVALRHWRNNSI